METGGRIRHKLMPFLERKFQSSVVEHLCQLAELAREDNSYLDFTAQFRVNKVAKEIGAGVSIPVGEFAGVQKGLPKTGGEEGSPEADTLALQKRMIREVVKGVQPPAGDFRSLHPDVVLELARR